MVLLGKADLASGELCVPARAFWVALFDELNATVSPRCRSSQLHELDLAVNLRLREIWTPSLLRVCCCTLMRRRSDRSTWEPVGTTSTNQPALGRR